MKRIWGLGSFGINLMFVGLLVVACSAQQIATFDQYITEVETIIGEASTDAQAACNAAAPVEAAVNSIANIPATASSGGYTTAQQNVLNAEAAVGSVCSQVAPASAAIIAGLNQVETYAQALIKSEAKTPQEQAEAQHKLERLFGAVNRSMSQRHLQGHRA